MEEIMVAACSLTDSIKPIALAVILPLPAGDPSPRIEHVPEPTYVQALVPQTSMKPLYLGVRTHCQLHLHRGVQEDVSGLFILFIHGWDESLNWSSIAAHGARIDSFSTTREGA
jgi:hypothetical protein